MPSDKPKIMAGRLHIPQKAVELAIAYILYSISLLAAHSPPAQYDQRKGVSEE
jgi:hypothetical protein